MDTSTFDLANLHAAASGDDQSFGDRAADWLTRGIPAALGSGFISMANTGIALGNALGADLEKIDTGAALKSFDDDVGRYYQDHAQGADLGGFLLTSLIPGTVGIKALRMVQGGTAGTNAARIVGVLKTKEGQFSTKVLDKIRAESNAVFSAVDKDKIAALGFGAANQALEGAAFETAVLLTMNQSPVLSKEDEGYFKSFMLNSHEILTAAAIQGTVGGIFHALSLSGKFKSAIVERDIAQFPSKHGLYVGQSDVPIGTKIAADFSYWRDSFKEFETKKAAGTLTDPEIRNYTAQLKNKEDYMREQITTKLLNNVDFPKGDGQLGDQLWHFVKGAENPEDVATTVFAAARKIGRVGTDAEPVFTNLMPSTKDNVFRFLGAGFRDTETGTMYNTGTLHDLSKVPAESRARHVQAKMGESGKGILDAGFIGQDGKFYTRAEAEAKMNENPTAYETRVGDKGAIPVQPVLPYKQGVLTENGPLAARHAKNIIAKSIKDGKEIPVFTAAPQPQDFVEMQALGVLLWKDADGILHVNPESRYAKVELQKALEPANPEIYLKLQKDQAGRASETVYPVLGDVYHSIKLNTTDELIVNGGPLTLAERYDPLVNIPFDSNAQFVRASLRDLSKIADEDGIIHIAQGDIPMLEAVAKKGFDGDVFYAGKNVSDDLEFILEMEKDLVRARLIEEGHGFDQIARELNVTQNWAETGRGEFMLSRIEDHTQPAHAAITYETGKIPNTQTVRGTVNVMNRVQEGYNHNQNTFTAILGEDAKLFPSTNGTLFKITTIPDFSTLVRSSSEDYGSFGSMMQQAGKVVNSVIRKRATNTFQSLQGFEFQVRQDPKALLEMNVVVQKFRSSKEPMYIWTDEATGEKTFVGKTVYKQLNDESKSVTLDDFTEGKEYFSIENKSVENYIVANNEANAKRVNEWNSIFASKGSDRKWDPNQVYVPPIDTRKYSHVAFIKEKMDTGPNDFNEAGVITAQNAAELEAKINLIRSAEGDRFSIFTKDDIKTFRRIEGEWESGPLLGNSYVDSTMRKHGLLYEYQPRTDGEILNDFNNWHWHQENAVVRQAVELKYAQEFAELRAMGKQFTSYADSFFGAGSKKASDANNPYLRYIHTGLDISDFDRYNSLWGKFNDAAQGVGSKMFAAWQNAFNRAQSGEIDWVTANDYAEKYGFRAPYKSVLNEVVNPAIENKNIANQFIAKMNGGLSTLTLGLDFLNSLINVISFPISGISEMRNVLAHITDPAKVGALKELTTVIVPGGSGMEMPTPMKLLSRSVARYFSKEGDELLGYYKTIGAVKDESLLLKDAINASVLAPADLTVAGMTGKATSFLEKAANVGKTISGHNKAEEMVRFFAADMMKQMTDLAGVAATDAPAYINAFVNRVHGNYLANQRPHLFQGVVGQAISLFQTYQFNLMQNMVRYVGQGDKIAAATLLGLQNTVFGLQGNPAFYILNQAIGNSNPEKIDVISGANMLVGPEVSKWIVYGLGSNAIQTSLYNRGDLTPRYVTVVPTQISDIPAVSIPYKALTSFIQTASNISKGGNIQASLLDGLAHFGANRPLSGLAQLAQGYRTTGKGDLLSAYNDLDTITVAAKLAGGEELNRAIAIDAYYRNLGYMQKDKEMRQQLGEAVKTTMYRGEQPSEDQVIDFMHKYARAGGSPVGFNRWMMETNKHANQSTMNRMKEHVNSRAGRLQAQLMGADTQDYWSKAPASNAEGEF